MTETNDETPLYDEPENLATQVLFVAFAYVYFLSASSFLTIHSPRVEFAQQQMDLLVFEEISVEHCII